MGLVSGAITIVISKTLITDYHNKCYSNNEKKSEIFQLPNVTKGQREQLLLER